jgi:hypothetical protein
MNAYNKSVELLLKCSAPEGFLAAGQNISNYKRVWARDGIICGLAAIAAGNNQLIAIFESTINTLATNQHQNGTIPSNVAINANDTQVSYGGLAGRVDAVSWFIIGICQLAFYKNDYTILEKYKSNIRKCLQLMEAWEFNNKHLMYVPLSGNWADEYITDGYILYDQLLRLWALKNLNYFENDTMLTAKIKAIKNQIETNFCPNQDQEKFHERAYNQLDFANYMPASFSPAGYKNYFDAFANSLALILNIGDDAFQNKIIDFAQNLQQATTLQLIPAFYPTIQQTDLDWSLLKNNCKYEFRNYPNQFHNGGSWAMVNGFFGLALLHKKKDATALLNAINQANAINDYGFYENFDTKTTAPNGVKYCAWSAAAAIILHQNIHTNFKFLT